MHYRTFSNIPGTRNVPIAPTQSCDNQGCLWKLPNVRKSLLEWNYWLDPRILWIRRHEENTPGASGKRNRQPPIKRGTGALSSEPFWNATLPTLDTAHCTTAWQVTAGHVLTRRLPSHACLLPPRPSHPSILYLTVSFSPLSPESQI